MVVGNQKIQPLTESLLGDTNGALFPGKILIQTDNQLIIIAVSHMVWIDAKGDDAKLITAKGSPLSNYGISALESKLNPPQFIRVHRSVIINIRFVKEIQKYVASFEA